VGDGNPTVAPLVATALPQPTTRARVELALGQKSSDQSVVLACSVQVVEGRAEVELVVVADAVCSLAVAIEGLTLVIQGLSAAVAKQEDHLERHAQVQQATDEIRAMLDQIRSWLPPPPTNEQPELH
jgi:hypothetical protein